MGIVASFFARLFGGTPDPCNDTNDEIKKHHETERQGRAAEQAGTDFAGTEKETHEKESKRQAEEAKMAADIAREEERRVKGDLIQTNFYLSKGIQPEVWPTEEEFQLAQERIQYDPEKIHFAVCGSSGSGKSSLVNAFRGLKNNKGPHAARTDVVEATKKITRYPDLRQEMPYKRLVWFDCPGAGTLEVPRWQYFNQQGLFIFDVIVLVYDTRFTEIDLSIIQNCERFKIPLFIVRSKADIHIRNMMADDENDDDDDDDAESNIEEHQEKARQLLIDKTKQNLKMNLEKAGLAMHDIFIVSSSVIHSLVTMKPNKNPTPMIDEERLVQSIMKAACERRYRTQAAAWQSSWAMFKQVIIYQAERFKNNMITASPLTLIDHQLSKEEHDKRDHEPTSHMPQQLIAHQSSGERYMDMSPLLLMPN